MAWPERKRKTELVKVIRDWQATGNITFSVPDGANKKDKHHYSLKVEEERLVELLGGGKSREIRWRLASLEEAVKVVAAYQESDMINKIAYVPTGDNQ